jgi:hypothetical protein
MGMHERATGRIQCSQEELSEPSALPEEITEGMGAFIFLQHVSIGIRSSLCMPHIVQGGAWAFDLFAIPLTRVGRSTKLNTPRSKAAQVFAFRGESLTKYLHPTLCAARK